MLQDQMNMTDRNPAPRWGNVLGAPSLYRLPDGTYVTRAVARAFDTAQDCQAAAHRGFVTCYHHTEKGLQRVNRAPAPEPRASKAFVVLLGGVALVFLYLTYLVFAAFYELYAF